MNITKLSKIQSVLDEMTSTFYTPGINCLVLKDGKEVGYFESGYSDYEAKKPINRNSLFRLYSMSKTVTSVATFILIERGMIDLFDNVSTYLPGFKSPSIISDNGKITASTREVRIYDLLSMSSGIPYPSDTASGKAIGTITDELISKMDTDDAISTVDFANLIGKCPLAFEPGSHFMYGFSADILGAIIEVASGQRYSDFLDENIFKPLGMLDTGFYVPENKQDRLTKVYTSKNDSLELYTYPNLGVSNHMKKLPAFESGGAGLCSQIDDFVPFTQMLLNGGIYNGVRILSSTSVKAISSHHLENHLQNDFDRDWQHLAGYSYGNLMRVMINSDHAMTLGCNGEFGWDGWLGTYVAMDPINNLTILLMQQRFDTGTTEYTRKIKNIIYSALDD